MRILVVEPDRNVAVEVAHHLRLEPFIVSVVHSGEQARVLLSSNTYDLIILAWLLPDISGVELCQQIRQQGIETLILLLTIKQATEDIVTGLDNGADAYVTKPFKIPILLAQVRALLRRGNLRQSGSVLVCEVIELDLVHAKATINGELIGLTRQEYQLLELFFRHPKHVLSRVSILQKVWCLEACPQDTVIPNLVKNLRQKIRQSGGDPGMIETIVGMGYRLRTAPETLPGTSKDP